MSVRIGEKKGKPSAKLPLFTHKHPFFGDEGIIENHNRIRNTVVRERCLDYLSFSHLNWSGNQTHTIPVSWDGKGNCIILVLFSQSTCRNHDYLVSISYHCYRDLRPSYYDPIIPFLNYMNICIRVGLLRRPLNPVSFHVCLSTSSG